MLKIAVIDERRFNLKKIVDQFSSSDNIQVLFSVATVRELERAVVSNLSIFPDLVLFSSVANAIIQDESIKHIKKRCPNSLVINYDIVDHGDTLILSTRNSKHNLGYGSFALKLINILVNNLELEQLSSFISLNRTDNSSNHTLKKLVSKREIEVIETLSAGYSYEEIANKMCISINTVRYYVKSIYKKLGVKNKIELANKFNNIKSYQY